MRNIDFEAIAIFVFSMLATLLIAGFLYMAWTIPEQYLGLVAGMLFMAVLAMYTILHFYD